MFVPVVDSDNRTLMPTTPARARRWIKSGKATPFFRKGVFCVRLNVEPSNRNYQPIAVGIDPGSKREGFTVKSKAHTYLNVQTHAVDWVKDHVETRRNMRRARRFRNTPCRQNRKNRLVNKERLPPSTKARWQWKLRICNWLASMFPVTVFVVEDVKAKAWKKAKKWNLMFSPIQVGKQWFYGELQQIARLETRSGSDTYTERQSLGLKKSKNKLSNKFDAHCVDSWVLANWYVGGHTAPDNTKLIEIVPLEFHRRQLHRLQHQAGHVRPRYGGTMSAGFKRGSVVKHPKYGFCYVGGWQESPTKKNPERKTISLYHLGTGKRLTQNALPDDCRFKSYNSWRIAKGT
ncbi:MAG: RRXRR domain-containing protein [Scytonema sp. PMC 1069.18]|nr:RRXRR domain-containing protein [Scytonema sp. PMC 1069.18]MEC4884207.1 RRXRR domain-containing protein [Scytonema sp. PMC 1070.18]